MTFHRLLATLAACAALSACVTAPVAVETPPPSHPRVVERDLSAGLTERASR